MTWSFPLLPEVNKSCVSWAMLVGKWQNRTYKYCIATKECEIHFNRVNDGLWFGHPSGFHWHGKYLSNVVDVARDMILIFQLASPSRSIFTIPYDRNSSQAMLRCLRSQRVLLGVLGLHDLSVEDTFGISLVWWQWRLLVRIRRKESKSNERWREYRQVVAHT